MNADLYIKFNQEVWNRWLDASVGSSYFIAKYDDDDHIEVLEALDVSEDQLVSATNKFGGYYWSGFRDFFEDVPSGIGIIALQILSASRMTKVVYREGLISLMEMEMSHLQEAFDHSQHKIWESFAYAISKLGYETNITRRSGQYCFVSYPKYQSYLNKRDIESIVSYFKSRSREIGINTSQKFRFDDFVSIYRLQEIYRYKTQITNTFLRKLKDDKFSNEIIYRQLYQRYLVLNNTESHGLDNSVYVSSRLIFNRFDGLCLLEDNGATSKLPTKSVQRKLLDIGYKISKPIILKYDSSMMEYCEVNRFDTNDKILIITLNQLTFYQTIAKKILPESYYNIFMFFIDSPMMIEALLVDYVSKRESSIHISEGLKIHRKAYLCGYGPIITSRRKTSIFINETKYVLELGESFDLSNSKPGYYEIKIPDEPIHSFYIEKQKNNAEIINKFHGLSLLTLRYEGSDIYGQEILVDYTTCEAPSPRAFINNTLYKSKVSETPSNLVLRNLKRQII